jgi:hypothetical protein
MDTQVNRFPHPSIWITCIAIALFCPAALSEITGSIPTPPGQPRDGGPALAKFQTPHVNPANQAMPTAVNRLSGSESRATAMQVASTRTALPKCADCGAIEPTREVDTPSESTGLFAVGVLLVLAGFKVMNELSRSAR